MVGEFVEGDFLARTIATFEGDVLASHFLVADDGEVWEVSLLGATNLLAHGLIAVIKDGANTHGLEFGIDFLGVLVV